MSGTGSLLLIPCEQVVTYLVFGRLNQFRGQGDLFVFFVGN